MVTEPESPTRLAFGPFELNLATEELSRGGIRTRLSGQPFQILRLLLGHPGEVVTRDQLREQIWREGTFVDFEHGLNAAMNKLRRALGDSADNPRYIETLPGRGYRFIGALNQRPPTPLPAVPTSASAPEVSTSAPSTRFFRPTPWLITAAIAILGVGIWSLLAFLRGATDAPNTAIQFVISPPPGAYFTPPISRQSFAISPDGTRLAFTATDSSGTRIWLRDLSSPELRPIPGTEGAWAVFWSPDGRSIFYSVKKTLRQADLDTNFTRTFATLPDMAMSGAWRSNDDLLAYLGPHHSYEISTTTGNVREVPGADLRWAQFIPGTDRYIHVIYDPAAAHYRAFVSDFTTHQSTPLMDTDSRVQYARPQQPGEPGYLLFIRAGTLLAQPFDTNRQQLTGEPFPLAQNIVYFSPSASACFSVSTNGVLVYQRGYPLSELRWYDREGHVISSAHPAPFSGTVRMSPDGRRVAADVWSPDSGTRDIWIFDDNGKESRRLTYPPSVYVRPIWSPDGKHLAFGTSRTSAPWLATLSSDESGKEQPLTSQPQHQIQIPTDWSRDGRFIVYDSNLGEEEREVWLFDTNTHTIVPLLQSGGSQWGAAFSPDNRQIAFISDESGRPEVYVQSFEASPAPHVIGDRKQISHDGAWLVRWRPDGHELFYVASDAHLYAAQIERGSPIGEPKALFQLPGNPQYGTPTDLQFDVAPGAKRFVVTTAASAAAPEFSVIQNWQSKLRH
jgi:eukaryotic-like serine/threonine-protein kinase